MSIFSTVLLLVQLSDAYHLTAFRHVTSFLALSSIISVVLLIDSYLTLSSLEHRYHNANDSGSTLIDGLSLNTRRFREQRDVYLAFFTLIVNIALYQANQLQMKLERVMSEHYRLRVRADRLEAKHS